MTRTVLLGDICDVRDGTHDSPKPKSSGHPLVTSKHIKNYKIDFSGANLISGEDFEAVNRRSKVDKNDILISMIGTVGELALIDYEPTFAIKNIGLIKTGNELLGKYLFYYLQGRNAKRYIEASLAGSTQKFISLGQLRKFPIELPDECAQKKIADILGTIDEKIELNRKMNETLEQMGQALFRHYFIDNPEAEKWASGNISMFADNVRDSINPPFPDNTHYVALEHFTPRTIALYESTDASNATSNKSKFKKNDTLFGKLRPYFHKVAIAPFDGICSTDVLVVRPKEAAYFSYVSFFMSQKLLIDYATQASEGTRMPRTSWANICNYQVTLPPDKLLEKFNGQAGVFIEQIMDNSKQIQTLTTLRDTLLPRLINGKVKI